MIYGAKELAESFCTVRRNTIQIAEDIPEEKYGFRAAADVRTVGEELAHIACLTWFSQQVHGVDKKTFIAVEDFAGYMGRVATLEKELTTKPQILQALNRNGDMFASFLESLSDSQLAETVGFPAPLQPPQKTRFEMLLGVKEHEMHHRAKLMLMQRLIGLVPHLTKRRAEMQAQRAAAASAGATTARI
jgi:uncharacterized damage-inducible protein DinB